MLLALLADQNPLLVQAIVDSNARNRRNLVVLELVDAVDAVSLVSRDGGEHEQLEAREAEAVAPERMLEDLRENLRPQIKTAGFAEVANLLAA